MCVCVCGGGGSSYAIEQDVPLHGNSLINRVSRSLAIFKENLYSYFECLASAVL